VSLLLSVTLLGECITLRIPNVQKLSNLVSLPKQVKVTDSDKNCITELWQFYSTGPSRHQPAGLKAKQTKKYLAFRVNYHLRMCYDQTTM